MLKFDELGAFVLDHQLADLIRGAGSTDLTKISMSDANDGCLNPLCGVNFPCIDPVCAGIDLTCPTNSPCTGRFC